MQPKFLNENLTHLRTKSNIEIRNNKLRQLSYDYFSSKNENNLQKNNQNRNFIPNSSLKIFLNKNDKKQFYGKDKNIYNFVQSDLKKKININNQKSFKEINLINTKNNTLGNDKNVYKNIFGNEKHNNLSSVKMIKESEFQKLEEKNLIIKKLKQNNLKILKEKNILETKLNLLLKKRENKNNLNREDKLINLKEQLTKKKFDNLDLIQQINKIKIDNYNLKNNLKIIKKKYENKKEILSSFKKNKMFLKQKEFIENLKKRNQILINENRNLKKTSNNKNDNLLLSDSIEFHNQFTKLIKDKNLIIKNLNKKNFSLINEIKNLKEKNFEKDKIIYKKKLLNLENQFEKPINNNIYETEIFIGNKNERQRNHLVENKKKENRENNIYKINHLLMNQKDKQITNSDSNYSIYTFRDK